MAWRDERKGAMVTSCLRRHSRPLARVYDSIFYGYVCLFMLWYRTLPFFLASIENIDINNGDFT